MRLVVIGGSGATGRRVVERALELGHDVVAISRNPPKTISSEHLTTHAGDVLNAESLAPAFVAADAAISCIGPDKNLSPGALMSTGITNIIAACRRAGTKRLIMQSGITLGDGSELSVFDRFALPPIQWVFRKALIDKRLAEAAVRGSGLDWVIVRPVGLADIPSTTSYVSGPGIRVSLFRSLAFGDCAECLLRAAEVNAGWTNQTINVGREG